MTGLELQLPDGIVRARRCDCSICRRKGAVVASRARIGYNLRGDVHFGEAHFEIVAMDRTTDVARGLR